MRRIDDLIQDAVWQAQEDGQTMSEFAAKVNNAWSLERERRFAKRLDEERRAMSGELHD